MLKKFNDQQVFTLSSQYIHRKNPDGSVILMKVTDEDDFYKITGVAATIWQNIDGKKSIGQILKVFIHDFYVTVEQLSADTEPFLQKLLDLKIIE
jgi:hypothetical protein